MSLKIIEIEFQWTEDISVQELRAVLVAYLNKYGKPLRWAITAIDPLKIEDFPRQVKVEAVVIVP